MSFTPFPPLYPTRGFASRIFLPNQAELDALGPKMPFGFVLFDTVVQFPATGTIPGQQTARFYTSQPDGCYVTHLVGSSSRANGFVFQIYDTLRKLLWTPQPINFRGALGTAQQPFFFKKLYHLPPNAQLQCKVTNLDVGTNAIQIVAWGVRDE